MLDRRYLLSGLNALSRAHAMSYFEDGHRGGAIISAWYLCEEESVEPGVPERLAAHMDEQWVGTPLCHPFPDEAPQPELVPRVLEAMEARPGLRQAGHSVILPTLALKAFSGAPDAATRSRVEGVCRLAESFEDTPVPQSEGPVDLPDLADRGAFAGFVLQEFVDCAERFVGRGQGWSGHLLTYARALIDLDEMGHVTTARKVEEGFVTYVRRIRVGPGEGDRPRREHSELSARPLEKEYWEARTGDWRLGHVVKYPYGFYGLLRHLQDDELKARCHEVAYRIF
jgi:hypothetical protein